MRSGGLTNAGTLSAYSCRDPFRRGKALLHSAELQQIDPVWSRRAAIEIDRILVQTGIRDHANDWMIDCRTTICTVSFVTAIPDYDEDEASWLLTDGTFETAIWRRLDRENRSYLILLRSGYRTEA